MREKFIPCVVRTTGPPRVSADKRLAKISPPCVLKISFAFASFALENININSQFLRKRNKQLHNPMTKCR